MSSESQVHSRIFAPPLHACPPLTHTCSDHMTVVCCVWSHLLNLHICWELKFPKDTSQFTGHQNTNTRTYQVGCCQQPRASRHIWGKQFSQMNFTKVKALCYSSVMSLVNSANIAISNWLGGSFFSSALCTCASVLGRAGSLRGLMQHRLKRIQSSEGDIFTLSSYSLWDEQTWVSELYLLSF